MMLEGSNSSSAIKWVREDLDECLANVREHLEAFADNMSQRDPLIAVQEELEQLNLTFLTMEQSGASILTDEMIAVGGHMLHNGNANCEESLNALTDAVIVLPSYLDRLQAGHEDLPILLLPTLNELRATYDEKLMSEGSLFAPELDVIVPELSGSEADAIATSDFDAFARRIRSQYQGALLGWLKEQSKNDLILPMQEVCRTLYIRLGRNELRRLWWIAEMAMRGLRDGAIDNDLPLRRLFARLDLSLKTMAEHGEKGLSSDTITALSRALLFYAAQARPGSKGTDLLRERFKLEELIPDRDALLRARGAVTGRDAGLFQSIGDAVREELSQVKDTLDMELRTGRVDAEQRDHSKNSLRQLADTLNMLNLPVPARAVEDLLPALESTDGVTNMDLDSPLLALAQKLLEVEAILDTHIRLLGEPVEAEKGSDLISLPPQELRHIFSQMLDECVSDLHEVQEAVRKRLGGEAEADYLRPLERISGALGVASLQEIASLTNKLGRVLNASLGALGKSEQNQVENLDAITDAIAALELYLAGCRDEQNSSLQFIEIMQQRLDGLAEASSSGEPVPATTIVLPERPEPPPAASPTVSAPAAGAPDIDPAMLGIFLEEFDSVRGQLRQNFAAWMDNPEDEKVATEIRRGFHTLKGSGRMVGAVEIGDFSWRIEELLNKFLENRISFSQAVGDTISLAIASLDDLRARLLGEDSELEESGIKSLGNYARLLAGGTVPNPKKLQGALPASLLSRIGTQADLAGPPPAQTPDESPSGEETPPAPDGDPALQEIMVTEIRDCVADLKTFVEGLAADAKQPVSRDLVRAVHTLAGTFAMAPVGQESKVARALEGYLETRIDNDRPASEAAVTAAQTCLHRFQQRLYILEQGHSPGYPLDDEELLSELAGLATPDAQITPEKAPATDAPESAAEQKPEEKAVPQEDTQQEAGAIKIEKGSIISIFLEEAVEVLERCDTLLNTWRDKLSDRKLVQNLQREIHTFKGGARMAGLEGLGDLSHAMETLLEHIASNRLEATVAAVQALEEGCDRLNIWVEQLQSGTLPQTGDALERFDQKTGALHLPQTGESLVTDEAVETLAAETESTDVASEAKTPAEAPQPPISEKGSTAKEPPVPAPKRRARKKTPGRRQQERVFRDIEDRPISAGEDSVSGSQIRVAADLMDKLVNYSSEISIYRSRLEQQLGHVRYNLKEVDVTVQRLKEQLRKMDMESEAQMMSRYQKASTKNTTEFDPLELDRFSNMQQLSRALAESVSDLLNLHEMLDDSVRQAESLLTQQSRVSTEMQEGLMQTRMTPFGSAAPRLRRVVRAAAAETGKLARLQLRMAGSSDQLDRNVLERITAPLEHMLRNAIAHGIEIPKVRRKAKKAEEGNITVTVEAEATEFVIRVEDDGAGVNLDAIRKRAVERGLMDKDEDLDRHQLMQFIRKSGFSTSDTVTGLAGRGVGMDVVNSEIKQIGGSMEIDSEPGKGTCFTIRIPFSLAVMQAIAVNVGDRVFQVPLNSVAGVTRLSPSEYAALLKSETPTCQFAGEDFALLELEPLLDAPPLPLDSGNVSLLMIRAGDHQAAFRVAGLQGHQEVVVKPVGPQISSIPGILGGTIGADGQVMIILDMGPIIRRGLERAEQPPEVVEEPKEVTRQPLVMVVDDSITMRKVTSRVLDNHSIEVMTAQDGIDAIEQLRDRVPDLMLLDIEMPRMDGYELLEHVRADARLRHVPIVMITSRAGQKHRRKAREAGANGYLTKPYQEPELVEKVSEMLDIDLIPRRSD
ncbi:MAG: response regulator [Xanthomonadales bacterium]|nr:Hpt domain-containing protein [Gammaproteobacteria bacterium]MBT8054278.1 Hpt domain-containing protein [Gammaproteobacteria bacterium]NND57529.1 response regulator [Xanthomonadales bacterium]NNK51253.1 response regulator [Xanthomonadales bacterium]